MDNEEILKKFLEKGYEMPMTYLYYLCHSPYRLSED